MQTRRVTETPSSCGEALDGWEALRRENLAVGYMLGHGSQDQAAPPSALEGGSKLAHDRDRLLSLDAACRAGEEAQPLRPTSRSTPFPWVTCSELPGSYPASDCDPHDRDGDGTACDE